MQVNQLKYACASHLIGGLLGLFTGMSVLSIVEIIHWFGKAVAARTR